MDGARCSSQYFMKFNSVWRSQRSHLILSASDEFATYMTRRSDQNFLQNSIGASDCLCFSNSCALLKNSCSVASIFVKSGGYCLVASGGMGPICTIRSTWDGFFSAYKIAVSPVYEGANR